LVGSCRFDLQDGGSAIQITTCSPGVLECSMTWSKLFLSHSSNAPVLHDAM
jgi:hypothetical protein